MSTSAKTTKPSENPFLKGLFAPVTEEIAAFDLPVTGRLPAELNGRYLRNGPNPMRLDDPNYHWSIGQGMVHGVRLRDGRAEWRSAHMENPDRSDFDKGVSVDHLVVCGMIQGSVGSEDMVLTTADGR